VSFTLPRTDQVRLAVVDIAGREVARLAEGGREAGPHHVEWNGTIANAPAPAGLYFVRLHAGSEIVTRKFALIR
jgi:hypothetical protein